MQFLVLATDGSDPEAPARRQAARAAHLDRIQPFVLSGALRAGGALLDDAGNMIGSALIVEFPSRAELDAWLSEDPYSREGVWQNVEVKPFRLAVLSTAPTE